MTKWNSHLNRWECNVCKEHIENCVCETDPAHRAKTLDEAKRLTSDERARSYGNPVSTFADIAELWNARLVAKYNGNSIGYDQPLLTAEDVAWMMIYLKDVRSWKSLKLDNYVDAAAYAAIAGECAFAALKENEE